VTSATRLCKGFSVELPVFAELINDI